MAWVYLDDQFPDHPKIMAAGGDAAWLFVCGLAYCKRYGTEGEIPRAAVGRLTDRRSPSKLAARLVTVELWEVTEGGWMVHNWSGWNRSQESRSEAGRKGAAARWGNKATASETDSDRNGKRNATAPETHMANDAHSLSPPTTSETTSVETFSRGPSTDPVENQEATPSREQALAAIHSIRGETKP